MANNREFEYLLRLRADTSQAANAIRNFTSTLGGRGGQNPLSAFAQNAQSVSGGIGRIGTAAQQNIPRVNNFSRALQSLFPNLSKFAGLISETAVVYGIKQAAIWTGELTLQYERLNAKLLFTFTNQERVNQVLKDTRERANFLGQNFVTLTDQYASFAAASKGTTLSSKEVENVFFGVAKAGAALQLSNEGLRGSLFAIQQMMSKGKVNSEEFRLQLAERMPIALLAATRATGLTTKQFTLMLESGKILSDQFLPKFAKELENLAEGSLKFATTSLPAELERAKNAAREAGLAFGGAAKDGAKAFIISSTNLIQSLTPLASLLGSLSGGAAYLGAIFLNAGASVANAVNLMVKAVQSFFNLIGGGSGVDLFAMFGENTKRLGELLGHIANGMKISIEGLDILVNKVNQFRSAATFKAAGVDVKNFSTEVKNLSPIFDEVLKNTDISEEVRQQISTLRKVYVENVERLASDIATAYQIPFGAAMAIVNTSTQQGVLNTTELNTALSNLPGGSDRAKDALNRFTEELLKSETGMYSLQQAVNDFSKNGGLASAFNATEGTENNTIAVLRKQGFALNEIQLLLNKAKAISKTGGLGELANNSVVQNRNFLNLITSSESYKLQEGLKEVKKDSADFNRVISDATRTIENALDSGLGAQSKGDRIRLKTQAQINDIQNAIALLQGAGAKLTKEQAAYLSGTKGLVEAILFNGNKEADKADADAFIEKMRQSKSAIENVQGAMAEIQKKSVEAGNGIAEAFERGFDSALDSMADFIVTGKLSFGSFLQDMARMLAKSGLRTLFAQGIFPALNAAAGNGSIVSKIFSGFGVFHTGGRVGSPTSRTVSADPSLFANAPRFHTGLRPDEFPAILQRGETVIPRNQTSMGGGSSVNNVNVSINVDGPAAAAAGADPKATQKLTKELGYQVEEAVLQAIQKHNRPGGSLYSGKGRY